MKIKGKIILTITAVLIILVCIFKNTLLNKESNNIQNEIYYIEYENDAIEIDSLEDMDTYSDWIIDATVVEKLKTEYVPFMEVESNKKIEKMEYCDIWTYYKLKVNDILKGENLDEYVIYRVRGGTIDNVICETSGVEVKKDCEYIFFLSSTDEEGVYKNSICDGIILIENNKIVDNGFTSLNLQQYEQDVNVLMDNLEAADEKNENNPID